MHGLIAIGCLYRTQTHLAPPWPHDHPRDWHPSHTSYALSNTGRGCCVGWCASLVGLVQGRKKVQDPSTDIMAKCAPTRNTAPPFPCKSSTCCCLCTALVQHAWLQVRTNRQFHPMRISGASLWCSTHSKVHVTAFFSEIPWGPARSRGCIVECHGVPPRHPTTPLWAFHGTPWHPARSPAVP